MPNVELTDGLFPLIPRPLFTEHHTPPDESVPTSNFALIQPLDRWVRWGFRVKRWRLIGDIAASYSQTTPEGDTISASTSYHFNQEFDACRVTYPNPPEGTPPQPTIPVMVPVGSEVDLYREATGIGLNLFGQSYTQDLGPHIELPVSVTAGGDGPGWKAYLLLRAVWLGTEYQLNDRIPQSAIIKLPNVEAYAQIRLIAVIQAENYGGNAGSRVLVAYPPADVLSHASEGDGFNYVIDGSSQISIDGQNVPLIQRLVYPRTLGVFGSVYGSTAGTGSFSNLEMTAIEFWGYGGRFNTSTGATTS